MTTKTTIRKVGNLWCVDRLEHRWQYYEWADAIASLRNLYWHYGPTEADADPGKMWCYDCGQEVYGFEEGYICSGCGRQAEEA